MTEHKFTDEEVIKGLECLMGEHIVCKECAYSKINGGFSCKKKSATNALDLINRQREEIEEKSKKLREVLPIVAELKAEAVKEFAERLKKYYASLGGETAAEGVEYHVDQIAREVLAREEKEGE